MNTVAALARGGAHDGLVFGRDVHGDRDREVVGSSYFFIINCPGALVPPVQVLTEREMSGELLFLKLLLCLETELSLRMERFLCWPI